MKKSFDTQGFYAILNAHREARHVSWNSLAAQTGLSRATLSRLGKGKRPDVDSLITLLKWCKTDLQYFFQPHLSKDATTEDRLTCIAALIYGDSRLSTSQAHMLNAIIREVYAFCVRPKE